MTSNNDKIGNEKLKLLCKIYRRQKLIIWNRAE